MQRKHEQNVKISRAEKASVQQFASGAHSAPLQLLHSSTAPAAGRGRLYVGRVQEDADASAEGLGGQVLPKAGTDNAAVAVGAADLPPDCLRRQTQSH